MTKTYNKLVRDRIPEIIAPDGKTCTVEVLSDSRCLQILDAKLTEELADLLEVLRAVVRARGWTWEELEQARREKAAQRGGFEKKLLLKEVREK